MGFIQLNHVQMYLGQEMMNRYFYSTSDPIVIDQLNELATVFNTTVVPLVNALQSTGCTNLKIDTIELEGVLFSTLPLTGGGIAIGEQSPSWNALSFKLQRGDRRTKSGGKRISGLSETNLRENGIFPDPTYEASIAAYAAVLDNVLNGPTFSFVPVLISFEPLIPGQIQNFQPIVGASFTRLSTQNTRKPEL